MTEYEWTFIEKGGHTYSRQILQSNLIRFFCSSFISRSPFSKNFMDNVLALWSSDCQ